MASEVTIGADGRHEIRRTEEPPKRKVTQRLVIPVWIAKLFGQWVESGQIDLTKHIPLENYSQPVETVRQVER